MNNVTTQGQPHQETDESKCENCDAPATCFDSEGVSLCEDCRRECCEWTDETLNDAIGKAAFGKRYHRPTEAEFKSGCYHQYAPDFVRDRDSMAAAEETLTDDEHSHFRVELKRQCCGDWINAPIKQLPSVERLYQSRTARQRAFAFAKAKGLSPDVSTPNGISASIPNTGQKDQP